MLHGRRAHSANAGATLAAAWHRSTQHKSGYRGYCNRARTEAARSVLKPHLINAVKPRLRRRRAGSGGSQCCLNTAPVQCRMRPTTLASCSSIAKAKSTKTARWDQGPQRIDDWSPCTPWPLRYVPSASRIDMLLHKLHRRLQRVPRARRHTTTRTIRSAPKHSLTKSASLIFIIQHILPQTHPPTNFPAFDAEDPRAGFLVLAAARRPSVARHEPPSR